jgi:hypothetical protein
MLTSAWARLPVLGYYGSSDIIASHVARLPCYQDMADARRARNYFNLSAGIKVTEKERDFLPALMDRVSISSCDEGCGKMGKNAINMDF